MSKRQKPDQKQLFNGLVKDFHELVNNKQALRTSTENFFNNLIDEMTLGIIFDLHRKYKTNAYDLDVDDSCDEDDSGDIDIFVENNLKKTQECVCPNCDRAVAAIRFAPIWKPAWEWAEQADHETRLGEWPAAVKTERTPSDDDDDIDWNSGDRRKKKKDKNGKKKNRGNTKKVLEPDPVESVNVDIEGDDDDLTNLRDILHLQDHSNSTSPADSASSSGSVKKKDKLKSKKSGKRDRTSPISKLTLYRT
ncbi:hypothetical protein NQ318_004055 [Aromia moschata]|uniref:Uncharacterized protein n=1 Tax=Aromia moschata TaxID=1265417 RepID=A0AAV8ZA33_9CUCU|nr:hypothetical protein NQ318_004055 [Aromia moschata]